MRLLHKSAMCLSCGHTLQADSSCQLSATAGGVTANSEAVAEPGVASSDNIEWLKWTGAAVLFVEALIVSRLAT